MNWNQFRKNLEEIKIEDASNETAATPMGVVDILRKYHKQLLHAIPETPEGCDKCGVKYPPNIDFRGYVHRCQPSDTQEHGKHQPCPLCTEHPCPKCHSCHTHYTGDGNDEEHKRCCDSCDEYWWVKGQPETSQPSRLEEIRETIQSYSLVKYRNTEYYRDMNYLLSTIDRYEKALKEIAKDGGEYTDKSIYQRHQEHLTLARKALK